MNSDMSKSQVEKIGCRPCRWWRYIEILAASERAVG